MNNQINLEKPIKLLLDNGFGTPQVKRFYYSLMDKLKQNYNLESIDKIVPKETIFLDYLLKHIIENHLSWETFGASEIYEFNNMAIHLDMQNPGYNPQAAHYSILGRYLIMSRTSNIARDHWGPCILKEKLPYLESYHTFLSVEIFNSENGIEEFLKQKIIDWDCY